MFLDRGDVPFSFYGIMVDSYGVIDSGHAHRTDLFIRDVDGQNLSMEMLCNKASNVSPLSAVEGVEYLLPDRMFMRHFGG